MLTLLCKVIICVQHQKLKILISFLVQNTKPFPYEEILPLPKSWNSKYARTLIQLVLASFLITSIIVMVVVDKLEN